MNPAEHTLEELQAAQRRLNKAVEHLTKYIREVKQYEDGVVTQIALKEELEYRENVIKSLQCKHDALYKNQADIREMIDGALGLTALSRQDLGLKYQINAAGTIGAVRLLLELYKEAIQK